MLPKAILTRRILLWRHTISTSWLWNINPFPLSKVKAKLTCAEGGGGVLKCPAVRFSCVARANKLLRTLLARSRSPLRFDVGDGLDEQPNMLTCRDQMVHVR